MSKGIEKRKHHRQRVGLEIAIKPRPGHSLPAGVKLISTDVALEGMFCASNVALEPGTEMQLKLSLVGGDIAGSDTIDIVGRVIRCSVRDGAPDVRRHGIAIAFVSIASQERIKLRRYLNSL